MSFDREVEVTIGIMAGMLYQIGVFSAIKNLKLLQKACYPQMVDE
jgi:hypothetical protein